MKSTLRIMMMLLLATAVVCVGCKKNKNKSDTAADVDDGDNGSSSGSYDDDDYDESGGPANNFSNRNASDYVVSVLSALVMPTAPDGSCWDECSANVQTLAGAASATILKAQGKFETTAAKAFEGGVGLAGGQSSLPDVVVEVRCGHGNVHKTTVVKDKILPVWKYDEKVMSLDTRDECLIIVSDQDDDEMVEIGRTIVAPLEMRSGDKVLIYGADVGFGLVYSLEMSFRAGSSAGATADTPGGSTAEGASMYQIEVISARVSTKNKEGKDWDAPIPGASLLGAAGGLEPDLFVEAWLNGYKSSEPFMKTTTKKDTFSATFNEVARVKLSGDDHINFMVWDADLANHDIIGECKTGDIKNLSEGQHTLKCDLVEELVIKIEKR
ncbi:MAG: hypothetical protein M0R76_09150 [Proteobacteria bacterium]|nr:hypothetical protein [Pseudomonadota bacterium]